MYTIKFMLIYIFENYLQSGTSTAVPVALRDAARTDAAAAAVGSGRSESGGGCGRRRRRRRFRLLRLPDGRLRRQPIRRQQRVRHVVPVRRSGGRSGGSRYVRFSFSASVYFIRYFFIFLLLLIMSTKSFVICRGSDPDAALFILLHQR